MSRVWDTLGKDTEALLRSVMERFPDLAVWKFKSLSVKSDDVTKGVRREALSDITFAWVKWKGSACRNHEIKTPSVGPDANSTPWTFPPPVSATGALRPSSDSREAIDEEEMDMHQYHTHTTGKRLRNEEDETYTSIQELTAQIYLQHVKKTTIRRYSY